MAITGEEFNYIRNLVRDHSALVLEPGKEYLVESRLAPLARHEGFPSLQGMVQHLRRRPLCDLHRKVVETMANNETTFFRDARVFAMIKNRMVPELVALRGSERSLNIWCAACSSGQEPYSIAMLLRGHLPSLLDWNIRLIASDISREVLVRARTGNYSQLEVNRGLPAPMLVRYFEQRRGAWTISAEIRSMVEFHEINLVRAWPPLPRMDLIFLRNVLIYLELETKKAILGRAARLLAPGGYLVLGGAETTTNLDDTFEPVSLDGATCFRLRTTMRT